MITRETYTLENHTGNCYRFVVNRYQLVDEESLREVHSSKGSGVPVTLVLAHALGFHKETWEPFLEDLKLLQAREPSLRENGIVTEAWSLDSPSHGDSAVLNENKLVRDDTYHSSHEHTDCILTLLESREFISARSRRVILVGHSGGACAAVIVLRECIRRWGPRNNPFHSFVIIEIPLLPTPLSSLQKRTDHWMVLGGQLCQIVNKRRDKWASVKEAYEWLSKRPPYKDWDPRALRRYVEFGLRPLPTAFYPNETVGVTLKCYKSFESKPFGGREEAETAGAVLEELHRMTPVHLIFGQLSPFKPPDKDVSHMTSRKGKNSSYASATVIPNVNHLLVQEAPEVAARAVLDTLNVQQEQPNPVRFSSVL